ncbi:MAG: site-specific integrase, partial [bacterium]|nr:site-specific integrase [bacterium]
MKHDIVLSAPDFLRDFLTYSETIKGKSSKSIEEYYHDLLTFFRYIKFSKGLTDNDVTFEEITINDISIDCLRSITLTDLFSFLVYCKNERGNNAATRARKASTLRIFFRYLTSQVHLLDINPAQELDTPKIKKSLPVHLNLQECYKLLGSVDGDYKDRDYCILTIFLNCGLRLS